MLIDVILALILIYCCMSGYRKGLIMSLMGVVLAVICCLGATLAQRVLTPAVSDYLQPRLAEAIEPQVEQQIERATRGALDQAEEAGLTVGGREMTLGDLARLLETFGLEVEDKLADATVGALTPASHAAAEAIAAALIERLAGVLIFAAAFLILYLLLHGAALALNLVARLPVIRTCNRLGGAVFGLLGAALTMVVIAAVLQQYSLLPAQLGPLSAAISAAAGALT